MIEDMHSQLFPTYLIIVKTLEEEVPDIWGTKGKQLDTEGESGKRLTKKKRIRRKDQEFEVANTSSFDFAWDHQMRVHEMAAGAGSS